MNITKLPSGNYRIRYYENGKQKSVTLDHQPTEREAKKIVDSLMAKSKTYANTDLTFADALRAYIDAKYNVLSPTTRRGYLTALKRLSDDFRNKSINDIDQLAVQVEINALSARLAPKTVINTHGVISAVLAMYRPLLVLRTTLPQKVKKDLYLPSSDDIQRILDDVRDTKYYVPFVLGVCGCRRSEICAALPSDIDGNYLLINKSKVQNEFQQFEIKTTKTTESTRKIYLSDEIIARIQKDGVIYNGNDTSLYKALIRSQKKLDIPHFRFHDLRAYFASYAHLQGIPDQLIQEAGGWKTDATMKRIYRRTMKKEYVESQKEYWKNISKLL